MPWGVIGLVIAAVVAGLGLLKWIWLARTRPESDLARREERAGSGVPDVYVEHPRSGQRESSYINPMWHVYVVRRAH